MELQRYRPSERYLGKAEQYSRYRPSYPLEALRALRVDVGVPGGEVADVGSGTGIFSQLLLDAGFGVFAVEPNADMRRVAEAQLGVREGFVSVDGTAEATTLADASVDVVACAQAFHWFAIERVVPEFRRILRPGGVVCLIWNNQRFGTDVFHREYEEILSAGCPDYTGFDLTSISYTSNKLQQLFGAHRVTQYPFDNRQDLTLDGFQGRISSVSYCPPPDTPAYATLMREVEALFSRHQCEGRVQIRYDVMMYCIRLEPRPRP